MDLCGIVESRLGDVGRDGRVRRRSGSYRVVDEGS